MDINVTFSENKYDQYCSTTLDVNPDCMLNWFYDMLMNTYINKRCFMYS